MTADRDKFGSKLGFILAAVGSAVGIGNLVSFPVAATKNGGGAFLLIYTVFVVFVCLPVMIAELTLGRATGKDTIGAFSGESNSSSNWRIAGIIATLTVFMIGAFTAVIYGWVVGYLVEIALGNLRFVAQTGAFVEFVNHGSVFFYQGVVIFFLLAILSGGVRNGIERASKLLVPLLFFMLLVLCPSSNKWD